MKKRLCLYILLVFNGLISSLIFAQKTPLNIIGPESVGLSSDSLNKMNTYFHNLVDNNELAGIQTAIMRKGKLAHYDSYGYANKEEGKLLDEHSIFRIFSMTKPIVSVALMQMYEKGYFKLEDPLYRYLPEFKEMYIYSDTRLVKAQNPIRIIDLLTHTSGFIYGRGPQSELNQLYADADIHASKTNKELVLKLSKLPLLFEPGTDWQYGFSTNICGYLVEVLSGMSLDVYLRDHIFTPLSMHDTHFRLPEEKIDRFTVGYGWQDDSGLTIQEHQRDNRFINEVTQFNGGGGLVSTTHDYLNFCQMILNKGTFNNHQLLEEQTVDLIVNDHVQQARSKQGRLRLPFGEYGFGLGFAIRGNEELGLEKVYGWGGAVGTYFKIDTEKELIYILMIQLSPYRHLGLRQLFQNYVESAIVG